MKIDKLIRELTLTREKYGNIEVLIEVTGDDGIPSMVSADELNVEVRNDDEISVSIIQ